MTTVEQLRFDYAALDEPTRAFVQEKAQSIHARLKRTAEDIIAIGQDLIEVKAKLPDMKFSAWLRDEFDMSRQSAYNFMRVASKFGNSCKTVLQLPAKVLYELTSPSMPEPIIQMVETGQIPATIPAIREAKRDFPGFVQWQSDNVALGLDAFADVIPKPQTPIIQVDHENKERRDAHVMRIMGSSESPEWYTPQEIVQLVLECLGEIDVDPCSNSHESPSVPANTRYTREDDGLAHEWIGKVYMNPPYGTEIPVWIQKLIREYEDLAHIEEAIILVPARIDTQWFQPLYAYPMCHIRGRLQFENAQYSAPFPSIVVYLGRRPGKFLATFKGLGPIMGRIG